MQPRYSDTNKRQLHNYSISNHPKCQAYVVTMGGGRLQELIIIGQTFSRDLTHAPLKPMQCSIDVKVNFKKKFWFFPKRNFHFFYYSGIQLIFQFLLCYLSSGHLWEVKNKGTFQLLAPKVVTATYKGCLLTRGSKFNDLTRKLLVFWKTGQ